MTGGPSSDVVVHPSALCESDTVGAGTRVWAFAHVLAGAVIGVDCNVCGHAFVEGGVRIGDRVTVKNGVLLFDGVVVEDDVFLGPGVVFTNDLRPRASIKRPPSEFLPTLVRRGATLGAGAVVVCGTTIGENALVAAGAVVVADVPAHALAVGNPARRRAWVCACGETLPPSLSCLCGRRWSLVDEATGLRAAGAPTPPPAEALQAAPLRATTPGAWP